MSAYLGAYELRFLMKEIITGQFQYFPLVWMFHNNSNHFAPITKSLGFKREPFEYRMTIILPPLSYVALLEKDISVTIHHKNLQLLMTKNFKIDNNSNPCYMYNSLRIRLKTHCQPT